ncbi:MAG: hypothetical protein ACM359_09475 [Bacillota bacterium]
MSVRLIVKDKAGKSIDSRALVASEAPQPGSLLILASGSFRVQHTEHKPEGLALTVERVW